MSLEKSVFFCKVRLLLPLQVDRVVLGFLWLTVAKSCLLLHLDTVPTCCLGRPPVLGYLLHVFFIPQWGRWDVSLQNTPWRAWGWTGLEEWSRDEAGRSCAGRQNWEGAGGIREQSWVLLACHSGSLGWLVVKGSASPDSLMAHCFQFLLAGALHLPATFSEASSPHLFKLPRNLLSSLHWDALSFLKNLLKFSDLCM